jgi:hypothetical protein
MRENAFSEFSELLIVMQMCNDAQSVMLMHTVP